MAGLRRYRNVFQYVDSETGVFKPVVNSTVTVYDAGTSTPISPLTLFADRDGTDPLPNPMTAEADGSIEFWIDATTDVKVTATGADLGLATIDWEPVIPPTPALMTYITPNPGEDAVNAAAIQAALDQGVGVTLDAGTVQIDEMIDPPYGAYISGMGQGLTTIEWVGAAAGIMIGHDSGQTIPAFTSSHITIKDLTLRSASVAVTGIKVTAGGFENISNVGFQGVTTPFNFQGGFRPSIRNVYCAGAGSNNTGGSIFYRLPRLDIDGYTTYSTCGATAVLRLTRIAGASISHLHLSSPGVIGVLIEDDCQGVVIDNSMALGVTIGASLRTAGGSNPSYTVFDNFNVDNVDTYGFEIAQGTQTRLIGCDITNSTGTPNGMGGYVDGTGTAVGVILGAFAPVARTHIYGCNFDNLGPYGIKVLGGGGHLKAIGCYFIEGAINPAGSAAVLIEAGDSDEIHIIDGDWLHQTIGIVDQATSGSDRQYLDNKGAAPVITTPAGVTVRTSTAYQVDTSLDLNYRGTSRIKFDGTGIGLFGVTPVARPSAYTQTYATATRTHANPTATTLTAGSGTADGTVADVGASFDQTTLNNNFKDLATAINALIVDMANVKQVLNSTIDDDQAIGLKQ